MSNFRIQLGKCKSLTQVEFQMDKLTHQVNPWTAVPSSSSHLRGALPSSDASCRSASPQAAASPAGVCPGIPDEGLRLRPGYRKRRAPEGAGVHDGLEGCGPRALAEAMDGAASSIAGTEVGGANGDTGSMEWNGTRIMQGLYNPAQKKRRLTKKLDDNAQGTKKAEPADVDKWMEEKAFLQDAEDLGTEGICIALGDDAFDAKVTKMREKKCKFLSNARENFMARKSFKKGQDVVGGNDDDVEGFVDPALPWKRPSQAGMADVAEAADTNEYDSFDPFHPKTVGVYEDSVVVLK